LDISYSGFQALHACSAPHSLVPEYNLTPHDRFHHVERAETTRYRIRGLAYPASSFLVEGDGCFDGGLVFHCLETLLLPLLQLESLIDDAFDLDLATIKVVDGGRKFVGFAKGANDGDFVADWRRKNRFINDKLR
jgi:hypothetical protein